MLSQPINSGDTDPVTSASDPFNTSQSLGDHYATDTLGAITRQQYFDWQSTFKPIENQLISYATDPTQMMQAAQAAKTHTDQAFGVAQGGLERNLRRQGVTATPDQMQTIKTQANLQHGLADIGAENNAVNQTYDTQQAVLGAGSGLSNLSQIQRSIKGRQ